MQRLCRWGTLPDGRVVREGQRLTEELERLRSEHFDTRSTMEAVAALNSTVYRHLPMRARGGNAATKGNPIYDEEPESGDASDLYGDFEYGDVDEGKNDLYDDTELAYADGDGGYLSVNNDEGDGGLCE